MYLLLQSVSTRYSQALEHVFMVRPLLVIHLPFPFIVLLILLPVGYSRAYIISSIFFPTSHYILKYHDGVYCTCSNFPVPLFVYVTLRFYFMCENATHNVYCNNKTTFILVIIYLCYYMSCI
jgi:hypothetical protein